jgi:tetratricopeptide (TPR) repeat protein
LERKVGAVHAVDGVDLEIEGKRCGGPAAQGRNGIDTGELGRPRPPLLVLLTSRVGRHEACYLIAGRPQMPQTLHEAVGAFIERAYAGRLDQYVDVLAYNYGRTRNKDKQRIWFRAAGDAANAGYANEAAVEHFERLLRCSNRIRPATCSTSWGRSGIWSARDRRRTGLPACPGGRRAWRRSVALAATKRDLGMALMRRALAAAAEAGDERARGRIASDLATLHTERDAHADALEYLGQVLSAARRIGDRWLIAICIANAAELHLDRGEYDQAARYSALALEVALELGDWTLSTVGVGRFAAIATASGERRQAEQLLERGDSCPGHRGLHHASREPVPAGQAAGRRRTAGEGRTHQPPRPVNRPPPWRRSGRSTPPRRTRADERPTSTGRTTRRPRPSNAGRPTRG